MATREEKFRQAAVAYLVYGIVYLAGALYLASRGFGTRGMAGAQPAIFWFVVGGLFIVVFPWLIARGARARGYLWFTRFLVLLVAARALGVVQVAVKPRIPTVPLPDGGDIPTATGAWVFFFITLGTLVMLIRAAWTREP